VEQASTDAKFLRDLAAETNNAADEGVSGSKPPPLVQAIKELGKQLGEQMGSVEVLEPPVPSGLPSDPPGSVTVPTHRIKTNSASGRSTFLVVPEALVVPTHHAFSKQYGPWIEVNPGKSLWASAFPGWLYIENSSDAAPLEVKLPKWEALKDFVNYWDGKPRLVGIFLLGSKDAIDAVGLENTPIPLECEDKKPRTFTLLAEPREASREIGYEVTGDATSLKVKGRLMMDRQNCTVYFGVNRQIDVREAIVARLREQARANAAKPSTEVQPIGEFQSTFRDLDGLTAYTKALSWDDLIQELDRQSTESRPPIEIWGAKIPGWLGLAMLFGSQIYLLHTARNCVRWRKRRRAYCRQATSGSTTNLLHRCFRR
jgi:hypothetical protein